MSFITKRSPSKRRTDTPLGTILGYLQHEIVYWQWEIEAGKWLAFIPTFFPLNYIHDSIRSIFQAAYGSIYQRAYNEGADKGNEMNSEIMGWVDEARKELTSKVNSAKSELDRIISSVKSDVQTVKGRISALNTSLSEVEVDLSGLKTDVTSHRVSIAELKNRIKVLEARAGVTVTEDKKGFWDWLGL